MTSVVCGSTPPDNAVLLHAVKKMLNANLKLQSEGGVYRAKTKRLTLRWWPEEGLLVPHPSSIAVFTPAERKQTEGPSGCFHTLVHARARVLTRIASAEK